MWFEDSLYFLYVIGKVGRRLCDKNIIIGEKGIGGVIGVVFEFGREVDMDFFFF